MSLNPVTNVNFSWNYARPNDPGYSLELIGTIVTLQEVQAREFSQIPGQIGRPRFWPDGNPVMKIRVGFALPDGSFRTWIFDRAGRKQKSGEKPSPHMQLWAFANGDMNNLIGRTFKITTWAANPQTGQTWGHGNPRLYQVEEIPDTKYELQNALPEEYKLDRVYCNDAVSGGQMVTQQQPMMQQPPMQGQYYAAPQVQVPQVPQMQQPMQMPQPMMQQPMAQPQQPMMQQPMQMHQPQPVAPATIQAMPPQQPMMQSAPMPNGMDPMVAQAMQAVGAVNVQPVYDDEIPF